MLRNTFTTNIYKNTVLESKSINIFGVDGIGKSRFIEDLLSIIEINEVKVVSIDIRIFRNTYDDFINQIKKKLKLRRDFLSFSEILDSFTSNHSKVLLIIDNFEDLYKDNIDTKFNFDFFNELNSFKNRDNSSLIIVSTKNYTHYNFYHNNELSTSPLDLTTKEMNPLTTKNIEDELKRRFELDIAYNKLANMIIGKERVYHFIEFIDREVGFGNYDKQKNLYMNFEGFEKQFRKENDISLEDKAKNFVGKYWRSIFDGIKSLIKAWKSKEDKKDDQK